MSFSAREHLTSSQGGIISDILSLEEAWARFPIAMERANLGIGHLMNRPGFMLRMWDDDRSVLAQATMTPQEREKHVLRGMLRQDSWPLLIGEITHGINRGFNSKRVTSWCSKHKVIKKDQKWLESCARDIDCMSCIATGRSMSSRHSRAALEAMTWVCSVKWMSTPGIWSRCGGSYRRTTPHSIKPFATPRTPAVR